MPVPGLSTLVARPDAVFCASAGAAATSAGAGMSPARGSRFGLAAGAAEAAGAADAVVVGAAPLPPLLQAKSASASVGAARTAREREGFERWVIGEGATLSTPSGA